MDSSEFFVSPTHSDEYSKLELISRAGFNILYATERQGKRFCVKALTPEYRGSELYESLLRKEFEIGYSMEHEHICRTYSFEEFEGIGNAIVMEWINGRTLDQYIKEYQHSSAELTALVIQLCEAISYVHKRQVLHRDLKPSNIVVTHNGDNIKVIDFGLSDTDSHTALKEPAGSRRYASPELLRGDYVDSRSDIYSIGVIINELFEGVASKRIESIRARATKFLPSERYSNVEEIIRALRDDKPRLRYAIYGAVALISICVGYLFYYNSYTSASLIPSAVVDRVSDEEFARRQSIRDQMLGEINRRYVSMMYDEIYPSNCATPTLVDLPTKSTEFLKEYRHLIDSLFVGIKGSSLYSSAMRQSSPHNSEMFALIRQNRPSQFWLATENLYRSAKDSLAMRLHTLDAPSLPSNYLELSHEEQQLSNHEYRQRVLEYKISTVQRWADSYRQQRGLPPIASDVWNYYQNELVANDK